MTFGPQEFRSYARLRFLPDPVSPEQEEPSLGADAPDQYDLLRSTLTVLGEHTRTPEDLYFCMWDGWGTPPGLQGIPLVALPERSYFLFRGALADFDDWGSPRMVGVSPGDVPPPAFIWPADHVWCIAFDVGPHYAGIGAAPVAIGQLIAHPTLDVVRADPSEQQPEYA